MFISLISVHVTCLGECPSCYVIFPFSHQFTFTDLIVERISTRPFLHNCAFVWEYFQNENLCSHWPLLRTLQVEYPLISRLCTRVTLMGFSAFIQPLTIVSGFTEWLLGCFGGDSQLLSLDLRLAFCCLSITIHRHTPLRVVLKWPVLQMKSSHVTDAVAFICWHIQLQCVCMCFACVCVHLCVRVCALFLCRCSHHGMPPRAREEIAFCNQLVCPCLTSESGGSRH